MILFLICSTALASWRVVPIRIDLDVRNKTGSVKVINEGDTLLRFQLSASRWVQDDEAKDHYEETNDLIFFPRILSVPPKEERMVRTGFKVPGTDAERAYRLFIEQIPEKTPSSAAQVSILIRFGVPVFSAPLKPEAAWDVSDIAVGGKEVSFEIVNKGNVNLQIHSVSARGLDVSGKELFAESAQGWYLLTGHSRNHSIPLPIEPCGQVKKIDLSIKADKLELSRLIELGPEQCGQ